MPCCWSIPHSQEPRCVRHIGLHMPAVMLKAHGIESRQQASLFHLIVGDCFCSAVLTRPARQMQQKQKPAPPPIPRHTGLVSASSAPVGRQGCAAHPPKRIRRDQLAVSCGRMPRGRSLHSCAIHQVRTSPNAHILVNQVRTSPNTRILVRACASKGALGVPTRVLSNCSCLSHDADFSVT